MAKELTRMIRRCAPVSIIKALAGDRRGVIAVMFALMLPIMIGFIGLGVEVGYWFQHRRNLQTAADAAALAGAYASIFSESISTAATADATRNGYSSSTDTINAASITTSTAGNTYTPDQNAVEVTMTRSVQLMFAKVLIDNDVTINATAVAVAVPGGDEACVLALNTTAQRAINVTGTATVSMEGCYVASNSSASNSINVSNNADLEADCVSTVGDVNGDVTLGTCASANTAVPSITDPYEDLAVPTYSGCDYPSSGSGYTASNGETLTPRTGEDYAVICGGLTISSGDTVSLDPGIYIVDKGTFKVTGGGTITGTDVTIILTSSTGSNYADVSVNGGGTVALSAPTSGTYNGILLFQDTAAPFSNSDSFDFNGNSDTELTGVIYVPNNDVNFTGGNETDDNGCLKIVARTVSFSGNADLENDCSAYGMTPIYVSYVASLVE